MPEARFAATRSSFPDNDFRAVRHHDHGLQHKAHQSDHPAIRHLLTDPVEKALMMNTIKELSEINVHNRLVTGFEMSLGFGDGRRRAALRTEPVTAGMEVRLEHRLQDLEQRLLRDTIHDVGNAKTPLPAVMGDACLRHDASE